MPCLFGALYPYPRRFRRLLSGLAPASQPSWLRLPQASNAPAPVRLLAFGPSPPCAAATMASADFCPPFATPLGVTSLSAGRQISRGKTRDLHPIYPPHIRPPGPGDHGLRVFSPPCPPGERLLCGSCSSDRGFASSFLPTLPRDSAVAVRLGVPVTWAPRGLSPPSHFPASFRSPVDSAAHGAARRARRTNKKPTGSFQSDGGSQGC